jgi:hypothetical protein
MSFLIWDFKFQFSEPLSVSSCHLSSLDGVLAGSSEVARVLGWIWAAPLKAPSLFCGTKVLWHTSARIPSCCIPQLGFPLAEKVFPARPSLDLFSVRL